MENFISAISEILEVDTVELSDELDSFEMWDSLTVLSIIAYFDSNHGVTLTAEEIENSGTVQGLKELATSKK